MVVPICCNKNCNLIEIFFFVSMHVTLTTLLNDELKTMCLNSYNHIFISIQTFSKPICVKLFVSVKYWHSYKDEDVDKKYYITNHHSPLSENFEYLYL